MNKQQVEIAVNAGLELLGDKSEVVVPVRLNDGVFFLRQLLVLIAQGHMGLQPTVQTEPPIPPKAPKVAQPGSPSPKKRAAARKKRSSKKK